MTDVTLQVVVKNPSPQQRLGDIALIYEASAVGDLVDGAYRSRNPITSPRLGFVHVLNAPHAAAELGYLRDSMRDGIRGPEVRTIHMHVWQIDLNGLAVERAEELSANGETTISWADLMMVAVNKASGKTLGASL